MFVQDLSELRDLRLNYDKGNINTSYWYIWIWGQGASSISLLPLYAALPIGTQGICALYRVKDNPGVLLEEQAGYLLLGRICEPCWKLHPSGSWRSRSNQSGLAFLSAVFHRTGRGPRDTLGRLKRWMFIKLDNLDLIGVLRIKCPLQEEFQVENSLNFFHTCTAIVDKATEIEKFGIGNIRLPEIIWIARWRAIEYFPGCNNGKATRKRE